MLRSPTGFVVRVRYGGPAHPAGYAQQVRLAQVVAEDTLLDDGQRRRRRLRVDDGREVHVERARLGVVLLRNLAEVRLEVCGPRAPSDTIHRCETRSATYT
jgi:hypothetical protein